MAGRVLKVEEEELLERVHSAEAMTMAELDAIADAAKEEYCDYALNIEKFIAFSETLNTKEKSVFMELYLYLTKFIDSVNTEKRQKGEIKMFEIKSKIKDLARNRFDCVENAPSLRGMQFDQAMEETLEFAKCKNRSLSFDWIALFYEILGVIKTSM